MRLGPALAGAMLLLLPLAGAQAPVPLLSLPWSLPDCAMVVGFVEVDPARLRALLPHGFAPSDLGPLGRPRVIVEFAECGDVSYGNWEVPVRPPRHLAREDKWATYVKFDTLVQDAATREALAGWGLPARDGWARVRPAAAPGLAAAEMHMVGVGSFRLDFTITAAPYAPVEFPFLEFTPTGRGGLATWDVALRDLALANGTGVLTLPPRSALAALAGAARVPVDVLAGGWSSLGGTVSTPGGEVAFAVGPAPASTAEVAAVVAGGAAGAGVLVKVLRWLWPFAAYSRLTPAAALRHPRRRALLALVRAQPGVSPAELRRATGYAPGVVAHHLGMLERQGHVVRRREGLRTHLFAAGTPAVAVLPAARARVLAGIRQRPGARQRELAGALGLSRWAVAHHARRLAVQGLIRVSADGRERRHWPLPAPAGPGPRTG